MAYRSNSTNKLLDEFWQELYPLIKDWQIIAAVAILLVEDLQSVRLCVPVLFIFLVHALRKV